MRDDGSCTYRTGVCPFRGSVQPDESHTGLAELRIETRPRISMRRGAQIDYTIRWLGLPVNWSTLITDYDPPRLFVDQQIRGPYKVWRHRHEFRETAAGTIISDRVDYRLPLGFLGDLAHALVVRRQLIGIFVFGSGRSPICCCPAISSGFQPAGREFFELNRTRQSFRRIAGFDVPDATGLREIIRRARGRGPSAPDPRPDHDGRRALRPAR